jgi:hypothetical protein
MKNTSNEAKSFYTLISLPLAHTLQCYWFANISHFEKRQTMNMYGGGLGVRG